MAEESFYDVWEVRTKEEFDALRKAFKDAEARGPEEHMDVQAMLKEGARLLEEGFFDDL